MMRDYLNNLYLHTLSTMYLTTPFSMALRNKLARLAVYFCKLVSRNDIFVFPASTPEKSRRESTNLNNLRSLLLTISSYDRCCCTKEEPSRLKVNGVRSSCDTLLKNDVRLSASNSSDRAASSFILFTVIIAVEICRADNVENS